MLRTAGSLQACGVLTRETGREMKGEDLELRFQVLPFFYFKSRREVEE